MRQALAKQLVYHYLSVASCVMQPCMDFARSIVIYLKKLRIRSQLETAEDCCVTPGSWRSDLSTAPPLVIASYLINTRYLDEYLRETQ